jgi:hypothetical protein
MEKMKNGSTRGAGYILAGGRESKMEIVIDLESMGSLAYSVSAQRDPNWREDWQSQG